MMTTRFFQRIEVCFLDLIIDLLSSRFSVQAVVRNLSQAMKQKPVFISSIILGSSCLGMAAGYIAFLMTSLSR